LEALGGGQKADLRAGMQRDGSRWQNLLAQQIHAPQF